MLVCSVCLRAPLWAIVAESAHAAATADTHRDFAVELTEAATAVDATANGNVEFATLVDDPASVNEIVDAYLGETMLEAASAADAVDVAFVYIAAVDEAVTAIAAEDATTGAVAVARQAMIAGPSPVLVNSGTVPRQANVNGVMVNQ